MAFSFEDFAQDFPSGVKEALQKEGFDSLVALLSADLSDVDRLKLKRGHISVVREAIRRLQTQQQKGPLFSETKPQPGMKTGEVKKV